MWEKGYCDLAKKRTLRPGKLVGGEAQADGEADKPPTTADKATEKDPFEKVAEERGKVQLEPTAKTANQEKESCPLFLDHAAYWGFLKK